MQSGGFPARHPLPPDAGADPADSTRRQRPNGVFKNLTRVPFKTDPLPLFGVTDDLDSTAPRPDL